MVSTQASPNNPHAKEKTKVETHLIQPLLSAPSPSCLGLIFPEKFKLTTEKFLFLLPVFEDAVGDVGAHDGVDNEKNENWQIKPDELVQLAVEQTGPVKGKTYRKENVLFGNWSSPPIVPISNTCARILVLSKNTLGLRLPQ